MPRKKGNFDYNYPRVIAFLEREGYEYQEYAEGQHLKIIGCGSIVELWPSRMTYHYIESENPVLSNDWPRLSYNFNEEELKEVLG